MYVWLCQIKPMLLCYVLLCYVDLVWQHSLHHKDRTGRQIIAIENDYFEFIFLFVIFCFKHDKQKRMHVWFHDENCKTTVTKNHTCKKRTYCVVDLHIKLHTTVSNSNSNSYINSFLHVWSCLTVIWFERKITLNNAV